MAETAWHIEPLALRHMASLARAHVRCFPGYFLTNLGERFLQYFYRDIVDGDLALGYVAVDNASGEVVGFVTGVTDFNAFRRWSFRQRPFRKALIATGRLFCSVRLWGQAARRLWGAVCTRFRSLLGRGNREANPTPADRHAAILSIAVVPEVRGSGVAAELARRFERGMAEKGFSRITLAVFADNERAIRFYEKNGWVVLSRQQKTIHFSKKVAAER